MEMNDLFDFEFDNTENCWNVTHYYGKCEEVILPESYKGKPVKTIGEEFSPYNKRIKRVTIPKGYTSIGALAFQNCTGLMNIKLPESLTSIGPLAFDGCTKLSNIELPKNLTSIEPGAFENCKRLTSVILPESLTSIGELAFAWCTGLTNIKLPKNLTSISGEAFLDCTGLTEITVDKNNSAFRSVDGGIFDKAMTTLIFAPVGKKGFYSIPEGIVSIRFDAFSSNCKLTGLSFPESLLYIELCYINKISERLTNFTVSGLNPVYCSVDGVLFDKNKSELILYPKKMSKTNYVIPDGTQFIGDYAFFNCKYLENIVIPDSVSFIGESAFARCDSLKTITLSNKLRCAIEYVIRDETGLQIISRSGNPKIGRGAFYDFEGQFVYRD